MHLHTPTRYLAATLLLVSVCSLAADKIVIADFEGDSFKGWQVEGEAFGAGPARGNVGRQKGITGYTGMGLANSFHGDDIATGQITSPEFEIKYPDLTFRIAGGNYPGRTCLELVIDDKVVRSAVGQKDTVLRWHRWQLKDFVGKRAKLVIRDSYKGDWGWIAVDQIVNVEWQPRIVPTLEETAATEIVRHVKTDKEFVVTRFADKSMVDNPIALTTDENGTLYVAEVGRLGRGVEDTRQRSFWMMDEISNQSVEDRVKQYEKWIAAGKFDKDHFTRYSERIVTLKDTNGDGIADKRTVFADGFNDPADGIGADILYHKGRVYYTCIPNFWELRDADGDGVAEKRRSLQDGFGVRSGVSGHDMHGLEWGPDGKLYWSIGDRGYSLTTKEGVRMHDPEAGAVFRCDPDGSNIEIFCYNNRNPQDLAFDQYGNLFTVDNNRGRGDRSRVCYLVEGGDYGWNSGFENLVTFAHPCGFTSLRNPRPAVAWTEEGMWRTPFPEQPAHVIPAIDYIDGGSCGITYIPGASLGFNYPQHFLFSAYQRGIKSFAVMASGAGFKMVDYHDFWQGGLTIDTEFSPDGKLYVADYVSTRNAASGTKGDIYILKHPEALQEATVVDAAKHLANDFDKQTPAALGKLLSHRDQRVRLQSQFALVQKPEAKKILTSIAKTPSKPPTRETTEAEQNVSPIKVTTQAWKTGWEDGAAGAPATNDFVDAAAGNKVKVVYAERPDLAKPHVKSGAKGFELPRLVDGDAAANHDDVDRCVWFDGKPGVIIMSFEEAQDFTQIHSYSWHRSNRSPQNFTLWGSTRANPDPGKIGHWLEIARVDTNKWGDGGKHLSIVHSADGPIGTYKHLMWLTEGSRSGTFFTELDVYVAGQDAPEIKPVLNEPQTSDDKWEPEVFDGGLLARLHAIWGLGQVGRKDQAVVPTLAALLTDKHFRVRAQAAKVLGDLKATAAGPALVKLLSDDNARVQGFAATAIGKVGYDAGLKDLMALLRRNDNADPFLRHHAIYGLQCLEDPDALLKYADDESSAVRLAVQQVYRRYGDPRLAVFLNDADPRIVAETIAAIHDKRIDDSERELADKLDDLLAPEEDAVPSNLTYDRLFNANVRLAKPETLKRMIRAVEAETLAEDIRIRAVNWLGRWQEPHHIDPIIGQLRALPQNRIDGTDAIRKLAKRNLANSTGDLRTALFYLANAYGVELDTVQLTALALHEQAKRVERLQALEALTQKPAKDLITTLTTLASDSDQFVRIVALQALAERAPSAALPSVEAFLAKGTIKDKQTAYAVLGGIKSDRAAALLVDGLNELLEGKATAMALELVSACAQREEPEVQAALSKYKSTLSPEDKLAEFRALLDGGDVAKGEEVLKTHGTAQCIICHNVKGSGGVVAPDLAQMGDRAQAEYLLESLIAPSAAVVPGYGNMTLSLKDGTAVSGSLLKETDTHYQLRMPDGSTKDVEKAAVASKTEAISSMPPMTAMLKKHEIRDVIAYLVALNSPKDKKKH